jgi:hypothetical protein
MEADKKPKEESKYNRYYKNHKESIKEKAHLRYYLKVHGITNPPPRRQNIRRAT